MKFSLSTVLALTFSFPVYAQSICGTAAEGGSVTLTAPAGKVFTSVTFASYGTPNGSCGSFTVGACNAANSLSIVQTALIGNNSATIAATNGIFGDPCNGTVKRLYIEAVYATVMPLRLLSFSGTPNSNSNLLQWKTTDEVNTRAFDIERSSDGLRFLSVATVTALNRAGDNVYSFEDPISQNGASFYRLKMIDQDERSVYSQVIKLENQSTGKFSIYPNPAISSINLSGLPGAGSIEILTIEGSILKRVEVTGQTKLISIAAYPAGIYLIKYTGNKEILYQRMIKQ